MIWQGPNSYVDIKTPCSSSYTGRWHCNVQFFCNLLWPGNLRLSSWAPYFCSLPSLYRLYNWRRIVYTPPISQISSYAAQYAFGGDCTGEALATWRQLYRCWQQLYRLSLPLWRRRQSADAVAFKIFTAWTLEKVRVSESRFPNANLSGPFAPFGHCLIRWATVSKNAFYQF